MTRLLAIGLASLFLVSCKTQSTPPIQYQRPPADVPDAALVAECDRSELPVRVNGDFADELPRTRSQRDECAIRMDGVRKWREDAIKRAQPLPKE